MTAKKEWFENWFDSKFYPILYDNRDVEEASLFVKNLVAYLQIPVPSNIADIACGEGRFADQLASYGHQLIGLDLSEQRIEEAKKLENQNLQFYVHDMRYPFHINYFDYAFNFFTSFGYFDTNRDNNMAAHAFASCLKKGGTLVVDYFNEKFVEKELIPESQIEKGGYIFYIKKYIQDKKIIKEITLTDELGIEHHYQERVSAFELNDFIDLFGKQGLKLKEHFGNYQLQPFEEYNSPRLIMIFEKQ